MSEIAKLKKIVYQLESNTNNIDDGTWLDHLNPSQAFLVCMGAGPWKVKRRNFIQKGAIDGLGDLDLSEVKNIAIFKFPLNWQNQKTKNLIDYLNSIPTTMTLFIDTLKNSSNAIDMLYSITNTKGRAKILDLFARDYLKLPSFPIDRHVGKLLNDNGFPLDEKYMIELCKMANLDASHVARLFVNGSGKFTGNGQF